MLLALLSNWRKWPEMRRRRSGMEAVPEWVRAAGMQRLGCSGCSSLVYAYAPRFCVFKSRGELDSALC